MKTALAFAEWLPDLSPQSPGVRHIRNLLPEPDGWGPMPVPVPGGSAVGLVGVPSLLYFARGASGTAWVIAATATTVYRATSSSFISLGGGFSAAVPWQAEIWGDTLYLVNGHDPVQRLQLSGAASVETVPGLPEQVTGRYIAVVGDFLMLAYVVEQGGGQSWPFRVKWSGLGRPESFRLDPVIQSDQQDVADIGEIRGIVGGEYGLILGERGLARCDYVGPDAIWAFRTLEVEIGCQYPATLVRAGDRALWWSAVGWRMSTGGPSVAIGYGKVDEFFQRNLISQDAGEISAAVSMRKQVALWAFPGAGGHKELLAYHWGLSRWGYGIPGALDVLGRAGVADVFTDDPSVADILTDDPSIAELLTDAAGDDQAFTAALAGGKLCTMQPAAATVYEAEVAEKALVPGSRAKITRLRPMLDGGPTDVTAKIITRERQDSEATVETPTLRQEPSSGSIAANCSARFHRPRLSWSGPFARASGVEVEFQPQGGR